MNNSTFPRMPSVSRRSRLLGNVAAAGLFAAVGLAAAGASAQALFPGPADSQQPVQAPAPVAAAPDGAAPMPPQPAGGFGVALPSPNAGDGARSMTLQGSQGYLEQIKKDALQGADRLAQGAVPSSGTPTSAPAAGSGLPNATIANPSDLDALSATQRNIQILDAKVKEAKLAVELWGVVFNNEHAKAWREREQKEAADARKREEEAARLRAQAMPSAGRSMTVNPVVYEVIGSRATLLVPGQGEVSVTAGSVLQDGSKVASVNSNGVVLLRGPERVVLGFGTVAGAR